MWTGRLAGGETRGRERGTVQTRSSISRGWMTWKCQQDGGARCSAGTKICVESASSGHPYSVGHVWWLCKRMGGPRRKLCHSDCQGAHRQRGLPHSSQKVAATSPFPGRTVHDMLVVTFPADMGAHQSCRGSHTWVLSHRSSCGAKLISVTGDRGMWGRAWLGLKIKTV